MRYVYIKNGIVEDIVSSDPHMVFSEGYASQFIEVDEVVERGWRYENGVFSEPTIPQVDPIEQAIAHFEKLTTSYIQNKVDEYNKANGLAFKDIDSFTKYALIPTSEHNAIALQFITYADSIWKALRVYQATLTAIPTDDEVLAILDGVVF